MNTPIARATPQPWYRVDVFRGCKTGEIIEATPRPLAEKLRIVALGALIGVPLIVTLQWFFKVWTPRYYAGLDALAKTDPVASLHQRAEFTSLLLLVPTLLGIGAGIMAVILAMRLARAGRRPLPGATVRVRTEVVAGWWCVRLPAILWGGVSVACLILVWTSYIWLAAFFWGGYLDKRIEVQSKTSLRAAAMKPHAPDLNETGVRP